MTPRILLAAVVGMGLMGCGKPEPIIQTCPKESYVLWISSSTDGKDYSKIWKKEFQEKLYLGRRCRNCGGIHHPKEVFRMNDGRLFTISSETRKQSDSKIAGKED